MYSEIRSVVMSSRRSPARRSNASKRLTPFPTTPRAALRQPSGRATATHAESAQSLSSGTSDRHGVIRGEWPGFDHGSGLAQADEDFVAAALAPQRNAVMVFGMRDHAVSGCPVVLRDPIGAVKDLHSAPVFADPTATAPNSGCPAMLRRRRAPRAAARFRQTGMAAGYRASRR